ncbi:MULTISPECIES: XRE family transcriptional regulator [Microbacterium]|nr:MULTISPECIES: XRE family transcriptional regulator [Microbacterium]MCK6065862.1 XRE family transcriptional regulator [Microbacterium sp. EYE_512]
MNLRQWRERRGLSVSALAREAGVSKSTVSELERGHGNPSLDTIWALAKTLHVSLGALFVGHTEGDGSELKRLADAPVIAHESTTYVAQLMAGWRSSGEVELAVVTLAPHALRHSKGNAAGVIERVVCVNGPVDVGPVGATSRLHQGDMLMFPADQAHVYEAGENGARLVVVQQYPAAE